MAVAGAPIGARSDRYVQTDWWLVRSDDYERQVRGVAVRYRVTVTATSATAAPHWSARQRVVVGRYAPVEEDAPWNGAHEADLRAIRIAVCGE